MRRFFASLMIALLVTTSVQSADYYYVTFYAFQNPGATPQLSHSFACFVKTTFDEKKDANRPTDVESVTISWLPASGVIKLLAAPEPGRNFGLSETMEFAKSHGLTTTSWGPFEIRKEMFDRAKEQAARLDEGKIGFKALDGGTRLNGASNCIHALSDIVPGALLNTGTARGNSATELVVRHFQSSMIDPQRTHSWVTPYMGRTGRVEKE